MRKLLVIAVSLLGLCQASTSAHKGPRLRECDNLGSYWRWLASCISYFATEST
jgi:hypothetical protein